MATPVAIVSQPNAQNINLGQNVTFTVQATGNPLPTYQWQKNGANISGATSPSYAITAAQAGDAGNFRVIVTNSAGSVTSTQVALIVNTVVVSPVTITSQPAAQTVTVGQNATFSVQVTGTTPGYQWQKNGGTITGATSATYTINGAQTSDAANYRVIITNSANSVTSSEVALTVSIPVPVITNPGRLINLSVLAPISSAGDNFTLGYVVNGASATNASYVANDLAKEAGIDPVKLPFFFDPQTSGGMLISLPAENVDAAVAAAKSKGALATCVIGEVVERREKALILRA